MPNPNSYGGKRDHLNQLPPLRSRRRRTPSLSQQIKRDEERAREVEENERPWTTVADEDIFYGDRDDGPPEERF